MKSSAATKSITWDPSTVEFKGILRSLSVPLSSHIMRLVKKPMIFYPHSIYCISPIAPIERTSTTVF